MAEVKELECYSGFGCNLQDVGNFILPPSNELPIDNPDGLSKIEFTVSLLDRVRLVISTPFT